MLHYAGVCDVIVSSIDFSTAGPAEAATRKAKRRGHANIEYEEEREYENPHQAQLH